MPFKIGHDDFEFEARTINLSHNGALCLVDKEIPIMTKLRVAISLPGPNGAAVTVKAGGVVVRKEREPQSDKFYVAVYFARIKPSDQRLLKEFIDRRLEG